MKGFISYAHNDYDAFESLRVHLKALERAYKIDFWIDRRIKPGDYWTKEIEDAISAADTHILIVSPAFFASDYIFNCELPAINAKYRGGSLVLPVIVKRCCWSPFLGPLQAAPMTPEGKLLPVVEWKPRENGFDASREQLMQAIEAHHKVKPDGLDWRR